MDSLNIQLERDTAAAPLNDQISMAIGGAIRAGRLMPGARLPSWNDLAAQLGVARGTVRMAYENLRDEQLVETAGAAGTRVASHIAPARRVHAEPMDARPASPIFKSTRPGIFRICLPAQDAFPFKTWSRIMGRAARTAAAAQLVSPDFCGEMALRKEIAAYLGIARGVVCAPEQVFITNGFAGAMQLALSVLNAAGGEAWMENPGYTVSREILRLAGIRTVAVPVDAQGLDVAAGAALAPQAALVVVTPGQQAPTGVTLSLARRHALLNWAGRAGAWIIEDDYLGELQLQGRATPALASLDRHGRVLHIGTFSKTLNPGLRAGFLVAPPALAARMAEAAQIYLPAPAPVIQLAITEFLKDGHYLRHLRRMKRLYMERRRSLADCLTRMKVPHVEAGLSVLVQLPPGVRDTDVLQRATQQGLTPGALSWWYAEPGYDGLVLGVTNLSEDRVEEYCRRLVSLWT